MEEDYEAWGTALALAVVPLHQPEVLLDWAFPQ